MISHRENNTQTKSIPVSINKYRYCSRCKFQNHIDHDGHPHCGSCGNVEYQVTVKQTEIKTPLALRGNIQILHFIGGKTSLLGKIIELQTYKSPLTIRNHTTHRISYRIVRCPFCEKKMQHRYTFPIRNSSDKSLIFKCRENHELKVVSSYRQGLKGWY
jgi:hypothetical protein